MEAILLLVNDYLQFNNFQEIRNFLNFPPSGKCLDFTDYLNLRMTCSNLYKYITRFLCFDVNAENYILYKQIIEYGDLFLFCSESPRLVELFLNKFGYIHGQILTYEDDEYLFTIDKGPKELLYYYSHLDEMHEMIIPEMKITPLHCCAFLNHHEIFKIMSHYGDLAALDAEGSTPIHKILDFKTMKYVINNFQIDLNAVDMTGDSIFTITCTHGSSKTLQLLINHGVDPTKQVVPVNELIKYCSNKPDIIKVLVKYMDLNDVAFLNWDFNEFSRMLGDPKILESADIIRIALAGSPRS